MFSDKNSHTTVDGLNQKFRINKVIENGKERTKVNVIGETDPASLGDEILIKINVDPVVAMIFSGNDTKEPATQSFKDRLRLYADNYEQDEKIIIPVGKHCKDCEFRCTNEDWAKGLKSGYRECWKDQKKWADSDFEKPSVFTLWNFRGNDKLLEEGKYFLTDLERDDIGHDRSPSIGLQAGGRRFDSYIAHTPKPIPALAGIFIWSEFPSKACFCKETNGK